MPLEHLQKWGFFHCPEQPDHSFGEGFLFFSPDTHPDLPWCNTRPSPLVHLKPGCCGKRSALCLVLHQYPQKGLQSHTAAACPTVLCQCSDTLTSSTRRCWIPGKALTPLVTLRTNPSGKVFEVGLWKSICSPALGLLTSKGWNGILPADHLLLPRREALPGATWRG